MYFISATCFNLKVGHHQALQIVKIKREYLFPVSKSAEHNLTAQPNLNREISPSTGSDLLEPHEEITQ
jgi:hypothetical protein